MTESYYRTEATAGETTRGLGGGCMLLIGIVLLVALLGACVAVGIAGLYYASPEMHVFIRDLIRQFTLS